MFQSTRHSGASLGVEASTSERSVLVPPMSKVITLAKPASLPTSIPPITPPAGPEWQIRAGTSAAARAVITPPPECVTNSSPS